MFVKYPMQSRSDNRGSVQLVFQDDQGQDVAYAQVEIIDADMTQLTQSEIDWVTSKTGQNWPDQRTLLQQKIDKKADQIRKMIVPLGETIDIEYKQVESALIRWEADGRPENNVPREITIWQNVNNASLEWAGDNIEDAIERYSKIVNDIRKERLEAKKKIQEKDEADDIVKEFNKGMEKLDKILEKINDRDDR